MINREIYVDHAATTAVDGRVLMEMLPYFKQNYGNPSSAYTVARKSKLAIENARERIARALNCNTDEIYFTAGGSESDNMAIKGIMYANSKKGKHIITTKIEHPAILNTCQKLEQEGYEVTYLDVDNDGLISIDELKRCIKNDTVMITIMLANNEIGTIQNIEEIGKIANRNGIIFHTDAVQAVGNIKIDVKKMNIDALSLSAHKFYGPKGIGALYIKQGISFENLIHRWASRKWEKSRNRKCSWNSRHGKGYRVGL